MKQFLFRLARSPIARFFIGWSFAHMTWLIPVDRLYESDKLIAFHHPVPSYRVHILIVPKRSIADLLAITPQDQEFVVEVFTTAQRLIRELNIVNYRLITNGGEHQDVPLLHFHLFSD